LKLEFLLNNVAVDKFFPLSVTDEGNGSCEITVDYDLAVVHCDSIEVRVDGDTIIEGAVFQIDTNRKKGIQTISGRGKTATLYQEYVLDSNHHDYATMDAGLIVRDLIDFYFVGILSSAQVDINTGVVISSIDGYGKSVGEMMEDLGDRAGATFYVDYDDIVHFRVEGAESSELTISASDVFDVQKSVRGEAVKKVTVEGGCSVIGSAGSGIPHKYVQDRRVADNAEAIEVATALLGLYQTARVSVDIYTYGFWNLRATQTIVANLPKDGYDSSTETARCVTWNFSAGNAQTTITVGDENPDLAQALGKLIRDLESKRGDFDLTSSAHNNNHVGANTDAHSGAGVDAHSGTSVSDHTNNHSGAGVDAHAGTGVNAHSGTGVDAHAGTGVDAHAGTNTNAHSGTNTDAHAGASVIEEDTHQHIIAAISSGSVGTLDGYLTMYYGGQATCLIPCHILAGGYASTSATTHTHSFVEPNNHGITQPSNHSLTQPNAHSTTQPNAHSTTQPNAHNVTNPNAHSATQPTAHGGHATTQPNAHIATQPVNHVITQPTAHSDHTVC
jgi:hypothetical protein